MPEPTTRRKGVAAKSGHSALPPGSFLAAYLCILVLMAPVHAQNAASESAESATYEANLQAILRAHAGESRFRFDDAPFTSEKADGEDSA